MKINRITAFLLAFAVFIGGIVWLTWDNTRLKITQYTVKSNRLPADFNNFKVAQISDFHNSEKGKKIISALRKQQPDVIVFTGDTAVSHSVKGNEKSINLIYECVKTAPCYFVTGNHEFRIPMSVYNDFECKIKALGVNVLRNEYITLKKNNSEITIAGIDDPCSLSRESYLSEGICEKLIEDMEIPRGFTLLLSHRPETFNAYCRQGIDVVFSGHAHGGQVRIPFIGGIIAPGQGLFPKYDAGVFEKDGTTMILSRGIGNSLVPLRVNDCSEIIFTTLVVEINKK